MNLPTGDGMHRTEEKGIRTMKKLIIIAAAVAGLAADAAATGFDKPCTTEPKEKWMPLKAIVKIVTDHGYTVAKSKLKGACAEIYARDKSGTRVEFFIDPVTGNPVGVDGPKSWSQ